MWGHKTKKILVVTGSQLDKFSYLALRKLKGEGHKISLLYDGSFSPEFDFENMYVCNFQKTKETLEIFNNKKIKFDAVVNQYSDGLTVLVALLAQNFGCSGKNSPLTAFLCRSKYHMRKRFTESNVPQPKFYLCHDFDDIINAIKKINGKCVVKPIGSIGSSGIFFVKDPQDQNIRKNYESSLNYLKKCFDAGETFFSFLKKNTS